MPQSVNTVEVLLSMTEKIGSMAKSQEHIISQNAAILEELKGMKSDLERHKHSTDDHLCNDHELMIERHDNDIKTIKEDVVELKKKHSHYKGIFFGFKTIALIVAGVFSLGAAITTILFRLGILGK